MKMRILCDVWVCDRPVEHGLVKREVVDTATLSVFFDSVISFLVDENVFRPSVVECFAKGRSADERLGVDICPVPSPS